MFSNNFKQTLMNEVLLRQGRGQTVIGTPLTGAPYLWVILFLIINIIPLPLPKL